jgi:hypothetical protein
MDRVVLLRITKRVDHLGRAEQGLSFVYNDGVYALSLTVGGISFLDTTSDSRYLGKSQNEYWR